MNQAANPPAGAAAGADWAPPADLALVRRRALTVGALALVPALAGWALEPDRFFQSYLVAFVYWLAIPLGSLALMMLHHLSGGAWGMMIRRPLEAAARTLPLMAALFAPLLLGLGALYPWARPEEVAGNPHLQLQTWYLNPPFFVSRAVVLFAAWCVLAWTLDRMSRRQDVDADPGIVRRMQRVSAIGLLVFAVTLTVSAIDWLMSLEPAWFSSIYGFYVGAGMGISALAFVVLVCLYLSGRPPMAGVLRPAHMHDYGKLLLAFVVIWAYFGVSQLIIIWQGQIPEETTWYEGRLVGGWKYLSLLLVLAHFALPFLLLLARDVKRNVSRLARIAVLLLVMRWADLHWLASPAFSPDRMRAHWLDLVLPVALGGIWIWAFAGELSKRPLLPQGDPFLPEALAHD